MMVMAVEKENTEDCAREEHARPKSGEDDAASMPMELSASRTIVIEELQGIGLVAASLAFKDVHQRCLPIK